MKTIRQVWATTCTTCYCFRSLSTRPLLPSFSYAIHPVLRLCTFMHMLIVFVCLRRDASLTFRRTKPVDASSYDGRQRRRQARQLTQFHTRSFG